MTKPAWWPSMVEFARGLACDVPPEPVQRALEELGKPNLSRAERQTLARMARSGFGRPGGKARMDAMSSEQRSAFARLGGLARGKGKK